MTKYTIDYGNGVREEFDGSLEAAKQSALDGMEYTGEHVNILYADGYVCTTSRWFGVEPEEDDDVLVQFGDYGFYQVWNDELA